MYADRHARSSSLDPRSLGIAVVINGAAVGALLLAHPSFTVIDHRPAIRTYNVPIDQPPPPLPPEPSTHRPLQRQTPIATKPVIDLHSDTPMRTIDLLPPVTPPVGDIGPIAGPTATPTPALTTTAPEVDAAHRADLQPTYPAGELRAEHEGSVVVRVLIGVDGRVHQVERVAATSDAFFRATEERALSRWRFRPATRGGVPVEAWRTMSIRFVIPR